MITLLKSNIVGARDVVSIMYVELLFDVKTELPDKFYQINGKNFLIANGSLAIKTFINDKNESDIIVYKYNNGRWIKTADKYTGIITPISTITENGKYSIGSNNTIGTNNIDVNVADIPSVLGEKTITANGTYNASDDDVEGYSKVNVDVHTEFYSSTKTQALMPAKISDTWLPKTWNMPNDLKNQFDGQYIWTDGETIYFSYVVTWPGGSRSYQYVLNKSTSTWESMTWKGFNDIDGINIWTDGDNIYYSDDSAQYVLDKVTKTWIVKEWVGLMNFNGSYIWTDGENIYYSRRYQTQQYVLNTYTSTWSTKTWSGLTNFDGNQVWTDGDNIYCMDNSNNHYVLNKATSTWSSKTWYGDITKSEISARSIWTDGINIYISRDGGSFTVHYVLNKSTSTWTAKTWNGLTNFSASSIWTDGDNIYYRYGTSDYYLPINHKSFTKLILKSK